MTRLKNEPFPKRRARAVRATALIAGSVLGIAFVVCRQWSQSPMSHIDVHDSFEMRKLSRIWDTGRIVPGELTLQSDTVRAGRGAVKLMVHSGDKFEAGTNGSADSERTELAEADPLVSKENIAYEYAFSMSIPADFPIVPTRLVIAQWKQDCAGHAPCSDDSPVVAVRYTSGVFMITHQTGPHRTTFFETSENLRGKWTDFRFQIRFTPHESGLLRAWLNGQQVVDYRG